MNLNIYDESFIPTKEEWDSFTDEQKSEIILSAEQDAFDEYAFLLFYKDKDKEIFGEEIMETEEHYKKLTEKVEYLKGLDL